MQDETPGEKINRLERYLKKTNPLDIVICPELFISGYGSLETVSYTHLTLPTSDLV